MPRNKLWIAAVTALLVLMLGGATIALASGEDEGSRDDDATEQSITGADLGRASEAALDHTGGGEVTGTEVEDEESYYEVEVTLDDGSQVDVQLDENFNVVGSEGEGHDED
jgi:uncharacterized membrane protein YkoI